MRIERRGAVCQDEAECRLRLPAFNSDLSTLVSISVFYDIRERFVNGQNRPRELQLIKR